jgi:hypothetical protein
LILKELWKYFFFFLKKKIENIFEPIPPLITREGEVEVSITLGLVEGIGRDEDRGIAAVNHTIVEEGTEGACGRGGVGNLFAGHYFAHDSVKVRACFPVVVDGETGF